MGTRQERTLVMVVPASLFATSEAMMSIARASFKASSAQKSRIGCPKRPTVSEVPSVNDATKGGWPRPLSLTCKSLDLPYDPISSGEQSRS